MNILSSNACVPWNYYLNSQEPVGSRAGERIVGENIDAVEGNRCRGGKDILPRDGKRLEGN